MSDHVVRLVVNGSAVEETVPARLTLADLLRERLDVTSVHLGCEHGACGACTVLLDGEPVRACLQLAVQADGAAIRTLEGVVAPDAPLHPVQQAFWEKHGLQCGFCTPGIVMSTLELLERESHPSREAVGEMLSGHVCRCTGYIKIFEAVEEAANILAGGRPQ